MVGTREPRNVGTSGAPPVETFFDECRRVWRDGALPHRRWLLGGGAAAIVVGLVLRFYCPSAMWLDETISVNISRLPLVQIPEALSHDGAPPLYYVLLHFWMLAFGQSDEAVRAFSGVTSVACLPLFWQAGRRLGGRRTGWVLFFLALSSPFAINYATTARMYSLMILVSLLGFLALEHVLEDPSRRHLIALGAVTAAVLYTHYWGLYLVAVTGAWLVYRMVRERWYGPDLLGVRPAFGALVVGALCFLPWTPVFVFQTLHTGTPWTGAAGPADLLGVFADFAGTGPWARLLAFLYVLLVVFGVFGRPAAPAAGTSGESSATPILTLVSRPNPRIAPLAAVLVGTLLVAVAAGAVAQAAFVARYTAVALPLFLILVAMGIAVLGRWSVIVAVVLVMSLAGVLTGYAANTEQRTQAVQVAQVLNNQAQPGDLVVFCPDQLGPAVSRLLSVPGVTELTFPRAIGPSRVDWVDYKKVIAETNVATFAQEMLARLGPDGTLWVVERDGYPGFDGDCGALVSWLNLLKPTGETVVHTDSKYYEFENLIRYPS